MRNDSIRRGAPATMLILSTTAILTVAIPPIGLLVAIFLVARCAWHQIEGAARRRVAYTHALERDRDRRIAAWKAVSV